MKRLTKIIGGVALASAVIVGAAGLYQNYKIAKGIDGMYKNTPDATIKTLQDIAEDIANKNQ